MPISRQHRDLATALGADVTRLLARALPEIADAANRQTLKGSKSIFTATVTFQQRGSRNGWELVASVASKVRLQPEPAIEHRISVAGEGQLSLFVEPEPEPEKSLEDMGALIPGQTNGELQQGEGFDRLTAAGWPEDAVGATLWYIDRVGLDFDRFMGALEGAGPDDIRRLADEAVMRAEKLRAQ